ncbi:RagB/SusD family nutrient uptake outer membrane protein [Mucilaginibacter sp.]|uniref:RagB/SusD family nutrient uptake outer membrane protein n=1 Tax=Mucilaginibacter sp. TaxID=1882438 RepID=UPI0035BC70AE
MLKTYQLLFICALGAIASGCNKYLDEKPDAKLQVPSSVADAQALLDNYSVINNNDPSGGEVSSDDYYLTDATFMALSQENYRRLYTWQKDFVYANDNNNDWFYPYRNVFSCNTVLETMAKAADQTNTDLKNVQGQALFIRAKAFFQLAVLFAPAYDESTATRDAGIVLRLNSDFNAPSVRSSNKETFDKIISDLKQAAALLPVKPLAVYRASRPAAYGMLASTYLYLHQFAKARAYADSCLQLTPELLDFNTLNTTATYPVIKTNVEVVFESLMPALQPISNTRARIDTNLYRSYANDDLRKTLFFKLNADKSFAFRGSYEGGSSLFGGIATDEIYLIRAEASARTGQVNEALDDLNLLLVKRWVTGKYVPITAPDKDTALKIILAERRKELLMRGLRWLDLKRLNQEGANIMLTKSIGGKLYTLQPNDLRYAIALPEDLINLSGLQQNPR